MITTTWLPTSARTEPTPVVVSMPEPTIRPDTPALREFAECLRALACGTERAVSSEAPTDNVEQPLCWAVPGAFALLVDCWH